MHDSSYYINRKDEHVAIRPGFIFMCKDIKWLLAFPIQNYAQRRTFIKLGITPRGDMLGVTPQCKAIKTHFLTNEHIFILSEEIFPKNYKCIHLMIYLVLYGQHMYNNFEMFWDLKKNWNPNPHLEKFFQI